MNMSIAAKIADYFDIPLSKIRLYEEERIKNESAEPRQRGA
jgi:hypothetical protein